MKTKAAMKLAVECINKEMQRIAVDANLYDQGFANYPAAENSSKRRKKLREAIGVLAELFNEAEERGAL